MKKKFYNKIISALCAAALLVSALPAARATTGSRPIQANFADIKVMVDGRYPFANHKTAEAFAVDGTTYLPVRAVASALRLNVEWQAETSTVALSSDSSFDPSTTDTPDRGTTGTRTLQAHYANIKVTLDGVPLTLTDANGQTVEPFTVDGTTYLPVRAIASALDLGVEWDGSTNTVILTSATARNVQALTQWNLDNLLHNKHEPPYLELSGLTADQAYARRQTFLRLLAEHVAKQWDIVLTDDEFDQLDMAMQNEIIDFVAEICTRSKYTVGSPVRYATGSFRVDITISTTDMLARAWESYFSDSNASIKAFFDKYTSDVVAGMSDTEYAAYRLEYDNLILDLWRSQMGTTGYLPDKTVTISVYKPEPKDTNYECGDGCIVIDSSDFIPEINPSVDIQNDNSWYVLDSAYTMTDSILADIINTIFRAQ